VAVAAPREAAAPEHAVAAETSFGWAAAQAARPAPEPTHGWEVPAARAHPYDEADQGAADPSAAAGLDIPHPQESEAPVEGATLRLRTTEVHPRTEPDAVLRAEPEPAAAAAAPEPEAVFEPEPDFEPEPEPEPEHEFEPEPGPATTPEPGTAAPHSGIPGPGPVEIVAQAVARGLDDGAATPDLPHSGVHRGTSVTEVPVHLPFRGTRRLPVVPAPAPAAA
ncbi:hypothetical protein GT352_40695, partial [Streptomyces sp. SID1046]|nr:hypothetical protein [Streptomyces sp. SID1046]